ncbi:MAG: DUF1553 domain-containing protein [Planctomycetaceae bacterium]
MPGGRGLRPTRKLSESTLRHHDRRYGCSRYEIWPTTGQLTQLYIWLWNDAVILISTPRRMLRGDMKLISGTSRSRDRETAKTAVRGTYPPCGWAGLLCMALFATEAIGQPIDFKRDIEPVFKARCSACHGAGKQESGFRLDRRADLLVGGDFGEPAIVPGDVSRGTLLDAVRATDPDFRMPPEGPLLSRKQRDLIERWIKAGAVWPGQMEHKIRPNRSSHWAFQRVTRPTVPGGLASVGHEVDAFLQERLKHAGLSPSAEADARTLIRRVSVVLTGLPPTPAQVVAFQSAHARNAGKAYGELVDRLLRSPHFGERWAQHWLDVIRWAETNGSESNMYRKNAWVYRDYVVRSFNADKPYERFVFEQIAGDTVGMGDATGFLVSGSHVPVATVGQEASARRQARADRMDEILQTIGASVLGVTIGCARCHNHKFDPISIRDYYAMTAVFQDVEFGSRLPEYEPHHPRRAAARKLQALIDGQRDEVRKTGPWIEDWHNFEEFHFRPVETREVRVKFTRAYVRVDEMEVFGPDHVNENLVHRSTGVQVRSLKKLDNARGPIELINDGEYGTQAWSARAPKGTKERPWVQFTFVKPRKIDRIRLSTNREDFYETDYLLGLNPKAYKGYRVEVRDAAGNWKLIGGTYGVEQKRKSNPKRARALADLAHLIRRMVAEGPQPSFVARFIKPVKSHVLRRGSPESLGPQVFAAGIEEFGSDLGIPRGAAGVDRRRAFANWLTAKEHPLTARVMVNRIWHHVFGQGIVSTTSDFGQAGSKPTHPELLDWLASEFVNPADDKAVPWSMKRMIRLMVMSRAFRQQNAPRTDCLKVDADSRLLWRFRSRRHEAEVIRDTILLASGSLDTTVGGISYRIHNVKKRYAQWEVVDNHGPDTWRRLLYQERFRRVDDQMFTAFDFPDCGQVRAKRPVSTTPLQALNLLNSPFIVEQTQRIAQRALSREDGADAQPVRACFQLLLHREPSADELEICSRVARHESLAIVCRALVNSNEFVFLP